MGWPFWDHIRGRDGDIVKFAEPNNSFAELLDRQKFDELVKYLKEKIEILEKKLTT